jgi:hypothetical protein
MCNRSWGRRIHSAHRQVLSLHPQFLRTSIGVLGNFPTVSFLETNGLRFVYFQCGFQYVNGGKNGEF